jgi:hypothetical protein
LVEFETVAWGWENVRALKSNAILEEVWLIKTRNPTLSPLLHLLPFEFLERESFYAFLLQELDGFLILRANFRR